MLGSLGNPHESLEVHPSVHPYCLSNFGGSHAPMPTLSLVLHGQPIPTVKAALSLYRSFFGRIDTIQPRRERERESSPWSEIESLTLDDENCR